MSSPVAPLGAVHIALLDDHALFRQGMRYLLQSLPYVAAVTEAATLPELLASCRQRLPDVLLLDLQMPGLDGAAATPRLLQEFPALKIIVLSMFSADNFVTQLVRLGARSYLPKDVTPEQLIQALEEVLRTGQHVTPHMARALARAQPPGKDRPVHPVPGPASFTRREQEVLRLICEGRTAADIAAHLFISRRTVEGHWQNLLEKTRTSNVASLVAFVTQHGLLPR